MEMDTLLQPIVGSTPTSLASLLPSAAAVPKRADLLSLKSRLAALLPVESGYLYWTALVNFLAGKINRDELGQVMKSVLGVEGEGVQLHNALLLSILYNTTRPTLPPSAVRHTGWHKRQRDKDGHKIEDRDPKRRKVKALVMALGKKERADVKALALGKKDIDRSAENGGVGSLKAGLDSREAKRGKDGIPLAIQSPASVEDLRREYLRCLQTQHCSESRLLPDSDTLQDRMSLISFESGLSGGADSSVASLGVVAIETHLKSMISSVISLLRVNRAAGITTTGRAQLDLLANLSDVNLPPLSTQDDNDQPVASTSKITLDYSEDAPLSAADFTALFEISPYLVSQSTAVERLYALGGSSDELSDESETDEDGDADDEKVEDKVAEESKAGRSPNATGSKSLLRRNHSGRPRPSSRTTSASTTATGRDKYVIDPSDIIIPGHPDIDYHPIVGGISLPTTAASGSPKAIRRATSTLVRSNNHGGTTHTPQLSPSALRAHLFPDNDDATTSTNGARGTDAHFVPRSPSNNTSTDGTDSDDGPSVSGSIAGRRGVMIGGTNGSKVSRRKGANYEVVDAVRLLDGIV